MAPDAVLAALAAASGGLAWGWRFSLQALALVLLSLVAASVERGSYRPSPANRVTVFRAALVAVLAGFVGHELPVWLPAVGAVALALDGVDGWVARRTDTASAFGARFDMELDALTTVVLSMLVWQADHAGVWVLMSGAMRYLWVLACAALPWLRAPLPELLSRKVVCVLQVGALILALALPRELAEPLCALGLLALTWSFARDAVALARLRVA